MDRHEYHNNIIFCAIRYILSFFKTVPILQQGTFIVIVYNSNDISFDIKISEGWCKDLHWFQDMPWLDIGKVQVS